MAVTDVFLALGVTVTLALLVTGRLEWAGVAAGLAASAKYPGVILVAPIVVAGLGAWRRVGIAMGLAVAAFVLTSPFVVIHAGAAWDDFHRVQQLARDGWLGFENDPATPFAFGLRLWETLGPLALVAAAGIVIALRRRERSDLILLSFGAAYALSLLASHAHFDRYVLPLVPVLAVLAGRGRTLAIAALVAAVVPLWWSVADARSLDGARPASRRGRLDRPDDPDDGHDRSRPFDAPSHGAAGRTPCAPGTRPQVRPATEPRRAPRGRRPLARRRRWRHRPRARGCRSLPARDALLSLARAAVACLRDTVGAGASPSPVAPGLPHLPLSDGSPRDTGRRARACGSGVSLRRRAARRRDRGQPCARSDVRQLPLRVGCADRRRPHRARDRVLARGDPRRPVADAVPLRRRDRPRRRPRARDPTRRRVGARPGGRMGPRPPARSARRGDHALRPDERRARVRLADRREARRARHRAARAHRGTPVRDLDRRVDRGDLRHVVLARARVRHGPGARGRSPRAPRRGCGGRAAGAALAPGRRPRRRCGRRAPRGRRAGPGHDRQGAGGLGRAQLVTPLSRARGADAPQARPGRGRPRRGRLHGPRGTRHALPPPARRRGRHVALPPLRQLVPERDVPEAAVRHALLVQRLPAARARLQPEREEDPRHRARRRGRAETALARLPRRRRDDGRARPGRSSTSRTGGSTCRATRGCPSWSTTGGGSCNEPTSGST